MKPIKVATGDTGSQIYFDCVSEYNDTPLDLTGATVKIKWLNASNVLQERTMTIIDATAGRVGYKFGGTDFYKPAKKRYLDMEIEITLADSDIITCQDAIEFQVRTQIG